MVEMQKDVLISEFFMEILSSEMDYLNPIGENTRVIGVRDASV